MHKNNRNKKNNRIVLLIVRILSVMILSMVALALSASVYAETDLPIDIDEVYQIEGMGTRAVTVSRGIDLFSDSSREITQAMITQHQAVREEAFAGLFDPLFREEERSAEERLMEHVISTDLFRDGASFRERGAEEIVAEEVPIVMFVILFIACGFLGFIIAMLSLRKRKGQENVH